MTSNLTRAALFENLKSAIDEIDEIFAEYGFDPSDFDADDLQFEDGADALISKAYRHVHELKEVVED